MLRNARREESRCRRARDLKRKQRLLRLAILVEGERALRRRDHPAATASGGSSPCSKNEQLLVSAFVPLSTREINERDGRNWCGGKSKGYLMVGL